MRFAKLVGILALASCGARAPAPIDVAALVARRGPAEARRDLEIRILAEPRDVQAWLAAATLDGDLHRDSDAIDDYAAVEKLGGPLGTRWHRADQARFAALLLRRGEARVARGSGNGQIDLERATRLGASVSPALLARAKQAAAVAKLRHIDPELRAQGRAMLVELAALGKDPAWDGAQATATPEQHARFGVWLWQRGAKREAYEQLARWHDAGAHGEPYTAAFATALAWWSPEAALAALSVAAPPSVPAAPTQIGLDTGDDPRAAAAAHYARVQVEAIVAAGAVGTGEPPSVVVATTDLPGESELRAVAREFRRDPAVAARLARELVGRSIDRAIGQAAVGALFDALADPARARALWLGASEDSDDAAIVASSACAMARAGDGDAALVAGATAAAASGDPALTWIRIGHALMRGDRTTDVLTAMRSALDLAGANALVEALELAITASRRLGRADQAQELAARRALLLPPPVEDAGEMRELLGRHEPGAWALASAWVTTRDHPRDVALRAALVAALERDDVRRQTIVDELVVLAGERDPELALTATLALP